MSLKEKILGASDRPIAGPYDVPEWDVKVYMRPMSGTERDSFDGENNLVNSERVRARMLVRTLCDEKGVRIFSINDVDELSDKHGAVLNRLFASAKSVNRYGGDQEDDEEKNSDSAPN